MKKGDKVRYLNAVGGGIIIRTEGNIAYVDDHGFETPVLMKELVVVVPAGHEAEGSCGAKLMFDQKAFDKGRTTDVTVESSRTDENKNKGENRQEKQLPPAEETERGEKLNLTLAFEPSDLKKLSDAKFNAVLVNDSNYRLLFTLLRRGVDDRGWSVVYSGEVEPQELIDLATYTHESLGDIERVALQAVAFKPSRSFTLKAPVNVSRRLDLTKFHKLHCFRPGAYFDTPVIEIPLVTDDLPVKPHEADAARLSEAFGGKGNDDKSKLAELKKKYRADSSHDRKRVSDPASNPHKLLPPQEVDLHIGELVDSLSGLDPAAMLRIQLDTVEKTMKAHCRRIGQKIIFIHGKGEGVLRDAVWKLLRRQWPKAELQDASFQEYGFGATLVTIH